MSGSESVLVVGPAWVGDMVVAQSLYRYLKATRPGVRIDVVAPDWSLPLIARMPEVRYAVRLPVGHGTLGLAARYRLGRSLRAQRYDQAIILPRSLKAALVPFFAGARRRTGYRGEMRFGLINDMRSLDKEQLPMSVQRYVALGQRPEESTRVPNIPEPRLWVDTEGRRTVLERLGLDTGAPMVAFAPGAEYGPAKQWPAEHYAALARQLQGEGRQVWLFGSERDRPAAEQIAEASGGTARNLCGRTSLTESIDLLALAEAVVSNDSGLMHIAAAVDVPVIALYGSTSPAYTPPLTRKRAILHLGLECSPCFERTCRFGHYRCLTELSPERVHEQVAAFQRY